MATDAVIIGNPNSGSAGDKGSLERFADILRRGGMHVAVLNTEHPNHATSLAAGAEDRLVIAAGGDGTVNEVVNGLSEGATLGILPLGTANVLARELGIPLDPEEACRVILSGNRHRIDIGVATDVEGKQRRFACMAGAGFDAAVVQGVSSGLKKYLRSLAFPITAVRIYFQKEQPTIRITCGETSHDTEFAVVANGRFYGGDFEIAHDTSLDSGELEVILVDRVGKLLRADILMRIVSRKPLDEAMRSFTSRNPIKATAGGKHVPVQIDGEVWGELPMTFGIEPSKVEVIA